MTATTARTLTVTSLTDDLVYGIIREGKKVDTYRLSVGYATVRWIHTGDSERGGIVCVNGAGRAVSCDCRGFRYRGTCRHASATEAAIRNGRITVGVVEECRAAMADTGSDVSNTEEG